MSIISIIESPWFTYMILPLLIFFARIFDQSIGILRIIFATKGYKLLATFAGFFESLVWLLAISQIMQHLDNIFCYIAYAAGFASGNYIGIYIESKLSIGSVIVRVVFQRDAEQTIALLRRLKFSVTELEAIGMNGPVKTIFSTIKRGDLKMFIKILNKHNPTAFYTVEDVKMVKEGYLYNKRAKLLTPTTQQPFFRKRSF